MITEGQAKELMLRLRALKFDGDPQDATGARREVGRALMNAAENPGHAQLIVEKLVRTMKFFPSPTDVWQASEEVDPPCDMRPPQEECQRCSGTGFERVRADAVRICGCRKC